MKEIVLIFPFWSQASDLNKDSNYSYITTVLKELLAKTDWLFLFLWPDNSHGSFTYYFDSLFENERVLKIAYPFPSGMLDCIRHFDAHRIKEIESEYAPTIVWAHQVESLTQLRDPVATSADKMPFLLAQHHYIIHKSLRVDIKRLEQRRLLQMIGSITADKILLNSDHTLFMMNESFGEYLNDDELSRINSKSEVLKFGLIEKRLPKLKDFEKPVIVYNHRTEFYKQPRETSQVLEALRKDYDFELWMTQRGQKRDVLQPDRFVGHPDRSEYLKNIAVKAINTLNSTHETFCIAMLDSIALGHLVVVPDSVTFPELVPADYPYKFSNLSEQEAMIRDIFDHYDERFAQWSDKLRKHARTLFGIETYTERLIEIMREGGARWRSVQSTDDTLEKIDKTVKAIRPGSYDFSEFVKLARKSMGLSEQILPSRRVARIFQDHGLDLSFRRGKLFANWKK